MTVLDGYSRLGILHDAGTKIRVVYRPVVTAQQSEWRLWRYETLFLGESLAQSALDAWLTRRVVAWDWLGTMSELRNRLPAAYSQFQRLLHGVEADVSGERWRDVESKWATNLREGVILDLTNPRLARRSCDDCRKYWYLDNGLVARRNSTGEKELRPQLALVPCQTEFGCPKGTWEEQKSLNRANNWAYRHFQSCDAAMSFPDDDIVRYNASIIRKAIVEAERIKAGK